MPIHLYIDVPEPNYYYSEANFQEYQDLVTSTGSIQFVDTGKRYRFHRACYIGDRTAIDFDGSTMRKVNIDTLTVTSSKSSSINSRVRYFGQDRILTPKGILDFDGNTITSFSYDTITPGVTGVVWASSGYDIYKGIVDGDNITFTKVGTSGTDQGSGQICYGHLGAYLLNSNDTSGNGCSAYVNPETDAVTTCIGGGDSSRNSMGFAGPDGKLYRVCIRRNGFGRFQKIGTADEGFVGTSTSTSRYTIGARSGHLLGNFVDGGNGDDNQGTGYGSNSYYIDTSGNITLSQSNAFVYDCGIEGYFGFVDENGWLYPGTYNSGSGVILKADKTFDGNFPWQNPYLWR